MRGLHHDRVRTSQVSRVARSRRSAALLIVGALLLALVPSLGVGGSTAAVAEGHEAPAATAAATAVRQLAAGGTHTCAIVAGGRVRCWGNNTSGRLGLGDTLVRGDAAGEMGDNLPTVDLGFGRTAVEVAAGAGHTCARLDNDQVKCWGANGNGRLGQGDTLARGDAAGEMGDTLPAVNLGAGRVARSVATGNNHTCALLDNGQVKCWGNNGQGQLGQGDTNARGDVANEMGDNLNAVALGTGRTAVAVTAGNAFTCVLLDNGTVKCWGDGASGRLGLGNVADRGDAAGEMGDTLPTVNLGTGRTALAITAGDAHACALLDDATVKCWGENASGRLGLGNTADRGDAAGEMGDALPAVSLGTGRIAVAVTAGDFHTCALLDNAAAKCWGENDAGRLGLGNTADRGDAAGEMGNALPAVALGTGRTVTAVTAGGLHTCATLDTGLRKCWGENANGQLGLGDTGDRGDAAGEMGDDLPTADLGAGRTIRQISAGGFFACALLDDGTVKCWGQGGGGKLGNGNASDIGEAPGELGDVLRPIPLGSGRTAQAISAGANHACALLDNGQVKCWGSGDHGRLGRGSTNDIGDSTFEMGDNLVAVDLGTGRTAVAVSAGGFHTCAILDNGNVKCWGHGANGRLGLGGTDDLGDEPGEMGNALPVVLLGTGRTALAIDAGSSHTCAVLDNGAVKCWGSNNTGELGLGDTEDRADEPGEVGNAIPAVDLGTGRSAVAVTAGASYTCALLDNASVKCWGFGDSGQLGQDSSLTRGDTAGEMGDALVPVNLGPGRTATTVTAGLRHTCAVLDDATVKCWGNGDNGKLGIGTTTSEGLTAGDMAALPTVSLGTGRTAASVSAGTSSTCALLDDGRVKCWGFGADGVPGQGNNLDQGDAPGEMGDALVPVDLGSPALLGVSGTVTSTGSGARIPQAMVAALRTTDFSIVAATVADGAGNFATGLPPGSYFLYVVDRTGRHTPGFFGSPTAVTVTAAGALDADPALAPTRGSVIGKVTETPSGDPVPGAWALALSGTTGAPEVAVEADGDGTYTLADLTAGNHFIGWIDPTGDHPVRFSPNSPDVPSATPVMVTAGGDAEASGELPTQATTPGGATISGVVTGPGAAPIPDVLVIAMHAADFRLARVEPTAADGSYSLDLQAGSYKVVFLPADGRHAMEWHNNQPYFNIGAAANVTAPSVTNATLAGATGTVTGTVTAADTGRGLADAWVLAIGPVGIAGGTTARPDGGYTITGLAPGNYRLTFVDPSGTRPQEYYDNSATFAGATPLVVTANVTTPNINATLD